MCETAHLNDETYEKVHEKGGDGEVRKGGRSEPDRELRLDGGELLEFTDLHHAYRRCHPGCYEAGQRLFVCRTCCNAPKDVNASTATIPANQFDFVTSLIRHAMNSCVGVEISVCQSVECQSVSSAGANGSGAYGHYGICGTSQSRDLYLGKQCGERTCGHDLMMDGAR